MLSLHLPRHRVRDDAAVVLVLVVKSQLLTGRDELSREEGEVVNVPVRVVARRRVDLQVRVAAVVDEARRPALAHAVADVLVRDKGRVQPTLGAVGVDVDGPVAVADLLSMPGELVGVFGEEVGLGDGFGFDEFVKVHEVVAFVELAFSASDVGFGGCDDLAAVGINKLAFLERLEATESWERGEDC